MMDVWTDDELETAFARAPEANFHAVYGRYSGPLFRYLYRFTGNNQSSEEILHDIFVELMNGKFRSSDQGSLKAWLFTVAKHRGLNLRKKSFRETKEDMSLVSSERNLEDETIQSNLLSSLAKAESRLPADLQETWNLRKRGLDYQQIAEALAVPVGTVKSRFSRLVEFLRKDLA